MAVIDEVLEANRRYAEQVHEPGLQRPPTRHLVVVSCMDARLHVEEFLGLDDGEAHIIRNAGGIVTEDVIRSLIISYYIGGTREAMIINNTKCGMTTFKDEELFARIQQNTAEVAFAPTSFQSFSNFEQNVRRQVRIVRSHPWIPRDMSIRGFIYDVDTGRLEEVST
jgi:carbonic anhydrase